MRSPYDIAFDEEEARRKRELEEVRYCDSCGEYLHDGYYAVDGDMWLCKHCAYDWLEKQWEDLD